MPARLEDWREIEREEGSREERRDTIPGDAARRIDCNKQPRNIA